RARLPADVEQQPWRHEDCHRWLRRRVTDHVAGLGRDGWCPLRDDREHEGRGATGSARRAELDRDRPCQRRTRPADRSLAVNIHVLRAAALASMLASVVACSRSAARESTPGIHLITPATGPAYVEYAGLSGKEFNVLATTAFTPQQWA